jgi:hypothetical protein
MMEHTHMRTLMMEDLEIYQSESGARGHGTEEQRVKWTPL